MSKIHYFQRYDQKENWATNSTLLLLSRLYHFSQLKFQRVVNQILDEEKIELGIGVNFSQQERGKGSVVDGVIEQSSFQLFIETKLYDNFDLNQLQRHIDGFTETHQTKVLLALSKNKIDATTRRNIIEYLTKQKMENVKIASTTFEDIIKIVRNELSDFDVEMNEILDDYFNICESQGLIDYKNETMLVFTASQSLKENFKYDIYYDGASRSHNIPFRFIGLYVNKEVVAIGELKKIVYCNYEKGELISQSKEKLNLTKEENERIKSIIENTPYYNLKKGVKFMLVDKFHKTSFKKNTSGPIRAKKYFFLTEIEEKFNIKMGAKEVANILNGKEWK